MLRKSISTRGVRIFTLCALVLSAASSAFSLDPKKAFSQYIQSSWTTDAGLPQTSVYSIAQTRDGYLWIGTEQGVASFDGVRFRSFNQRNTPALPSNYVHRLLGARDGSLWIGTDSGLTHYDGKTWSTWTSKSGLSDDDIEALAEAPDGSLWIGTSNGLDRLSNGNVHAWHLKEGLPSDFVTALQIDSAGILWIGTHAGLASFDGHQFKSYRLQGASAPLILSAIAIASDRAVWCASTDGRIFRESSDALIAVAANLPHSDVQAMLFDHDGTLWLGFPNHGLARFREGQVILADAHHGLPGQTVEALFEDSERNLWVGTFDAGLIQLRDGKFDVYGPPEGLPSSIICCSVETADGSTWTATEAGDVVHILPDGASRTYTVQDGLPGEGIHSILLGRDGTLWIGHRHGVLTRYRNGHFKHFQSAVSRNRAFNALLEDSSGKLWIGTYGVGVMQFEGGQFVQVLPGFNVSMLAETRDGAVWVGTDGDGLIELKDGHSNLRYSDLNGLINNHVLSLWVDRDDTLWVGLESGGLNRIKNGHVASFTATQGLYDPTVANLMEDNFGNLWMGSDKGISRVSKRDLDLFAEGRITQFHSVGYDTADGLRSRETMQGGTGCGTKAPDGSLWFPTMGGLARIDPRLALQSDPPLPTLVESVVVDLQEKSLRGNLRFRRGANRVTFHFTALNFIAPARTRFRYKLEGYDTAWNEAINSRTASYTNLPAGDYRFLVQAARHDEEWNAAAASVAFTVDPSWYETPLALVLWTLCAALLAWGIIRLSTRRSERRRLELERLVAERTHQLTEEKSALAVAQEQLRTQATHDSLTGLWNHKAILELLENEIERARRDGHVLTVVMADLDNFKKINDTYGHPSGDMALAGVAQCFEAGLRGYDVVGRYGGEEFLILMPGCDPIGNPDRVRHLMASVDNLHFSNGQAQFQITCSFGVTAFWPARRAASAGELLNAADHALYEAKRLGRHRVEYTEFTASR